MDANAIALQRKIIGVLMRAARERAHRSIDQVAQRLGITPARVRQYEKGAHDIALPELEILSLYLQTPLSFFFSKETPAAEIPQPPSESEMRTRRAFIGTKLKQARLAESATKEECGQAIGRNAATIGRYERGGADIPIGELDQLARFLRVNLYYFIEKKQGDLTGLLDLDKLARMPKDVREFVLDPANLTYLRMAIKFADLPTERLKELGEILLVVK